MRMPLEMKTTLIAVALLLIAAGPAVSGDGDDYDKHMKTVAVNSGQTLEIECEPGGSVLIEGWDKETVQVEYWERSGKLDAFDIEVKETRNGATINVETRDRRVNSSSLRFDIKVPLRFDVEFHSAGGGFELIGVEGEFTGKTGGGRLSFEDAKGKVRMTTGGGGIVVEDCELDGKLSTGGGRVLVKNVVGNLRATSGGGNVRYDNVRGRKGELRGPNGKLPKHANRETVMISTAGGSINVDDAPEGAEVKTGGGNIDVSGAHYFVDATTGGGDIEIRVTEGWAKAKTGAGDIEVVIKDDAGRGDEDIMLMTGHGDVTLTIPAGLSVRFDLDLSYTKNSRRDYEIISDLSMDLEHTDDWDYSNGSPKKHIYGTGKIRGGDHLIKIKLTNGDIRIIEGR